MTFRALDLQLQSTVRKKTAAVHFTTTPCKPNTANRNKEFFFLLKFVPILTALRMVWVKVPRQIRFSTNKTTTTTNKQTHCSKKKKIIFKNQLTSILKKTYYHFHKINTPFQKPTSILKTNSHFHKTNSQ